MRTTGRAYQMGLEDEQISPLYSQLLANIETAAGPGSEEFSLTKTLNTPVTTPNGRIIGKINDIMFSSEGDRVEAFSIRMADGALNGQQVAIPIDSITLTNASTGISAQISEEVAKAMTEFAQKNK